MVQIVEASTQGSGMTCRCFPPAARPTLAWVPSVRGVRSSWVGSFFPPPSVPLRAWWAPGSTPRLWLLLPPSNPRGSRPPAPNTCTVPRGDSVSGRLPPSPMGCGLQGSSPTTSRKRRSWGLDLPYNCSLRSLRGRPPGLRSAPQVDPRLQGHTDLTSTPPWRPAGRATS